MSIRLGRFYWRRALRLTPALVVAVAVAAGVVLAVAVTRGEEEAPPAVGSVALPPIVPLRGGELHGGFVTRLSNVVQPNGVPVEFDHVVAGDAWDRASPSVLTVPASGWWQVGVNLTTLGERYGGPPNGDVAVSVVRNWNRSEPFLTSTVAMERFHNADHGWNAEVNSLLQPVHLEAGDRLEVVTVGGPGGLLIESNPSDGVPDGFDSDEGPGTLSPHFFLLPL